MNGIRYTLFIIGMLLLSPMVHAKGQDSVRISILTCASGSEIYELFGHTAIRYQNKARGEDIVFNYGMFNFNAPHFIWRYIKGETYYELGVMDYRNFMQEYEARNSSVYQQTLSLTPIEKKALYWALIKNYQPEHRVYLYNFFYDNCSTRPRDKVENIVKGNINYRMDDEVMTFREIVHQFTKGHPWSQFGIDLCLGSEADKPISSRQKMFSPYYLKDALTTALVSRGKGSVESLVSNASFLYKSDPNQNRDLEESLFSPIVCGFILLFITMVVSYVGIKKNRIYWGFDIALFGIAGIAGCILTFLACFSLHPAVSPNFLIFIFHPFHLIGVAYMIWCVKTNHKDFYSVANFVILTLFLWSTEAMPQQFNQAVIPLALCLLVRSGIYILFTILKKNK